MGLVDLRGRTDDAAVTALVAQLPRRAGAGADASKTRLLLGWSVDAELVGCLGVERGDGREVQLRDVFVLEAHRRQGIGRALVEALVAGAPAERFVARCKNSEAEFFERLGFATAGDGTLVRSVPAVAAPAGDVAALTLADLEAAIRAAWGRDTSADPDEWAADNPARGQCDATAALVRSYLGGEILVADVVRNGQRLERHAWNRLPSGLSLDLTRDQFRGGEQLGPPDAREPMMLGDSAARHRLLADRVAAALASAS